MAMLLRRFLVVAALAFWQGGFTFYGAVVVPVGNEVLGSHTDQGFITRRVTNYLNLAGGVSLFALAWDVASGERTAWRRRARWGAWGALALTLGLLIWLHVRLDALLDPETFRVLDRKAFRTEHQWYLLVSTLQWACSLIYAVLTLSAWHAADSSKAC